MDMSFTVIFIGLPVLALAAAWAAWTIRSPAKAALGSWISTSILALFIFFKMAAGRIGASMMTHTNEQFSPPILERLGQLLLLGMTLMIPVWVYRHKSRLKTPEPTEDDDG
jgi:uncharacterized membrane protein